MHGRTPNPRATPRSARLAAVVVAALAVGACSTGSGVSRTSTGTAPDDAPTESVSDDEAVPLPDDEADSSADAEPAATPEPPAEPERPVVDVSAFTPAPIEWDAYDEQVDLGVLDVPVDYTDPDGPQFELFMARYRALDPERRIGTLLVNPGGPGVPGSDFAVFAAQIFDEELLQTFDIIGWDPRGTGESDPAIDCVDDYDRYFTSVDRTPATDEARAELVQLAEDFARGCVGNNRDIIQFVGTNNSARDIDSIRRSLGEDQLSFFGFSYGSELGAAWATMFPDTVRALVLDGASDPAADRLESSLAQLAGFDGTLTTFLAGCSDDDECAFHNDGDSETAFDELLLQLDEQPVPADPDRPPVNRDVALSGVYQAMYSEGFWPALAESLADAAAGDGSGLMAFHDAYYRRRNDGTWGNELEAFQVISCLDSTERRTVEENDELAPTFHEVAPRLAPVDAVGYFCTFLPPADDPRIDVTGAGAGPIVVIGTTGDPATPFASTRKMADTLDDGRLVIVEGDEHTGYRVNRCVIDVVNTYLVDLEPPDDETECR